MNNNFKDLKVGYSFIDTALNKDREDNKMPTSYPGIKYPDAL